VKLHAYGSSVLDTVGRRGALSYEFERAGPRTILTRSSCTSPWHHFPPSYLDDSGCAYTWLVNPSGGLVGGDHVSVEAQFHAGTHALMTSPSANRVYRSLSKPVLQEIRLSVGPEARLEWLPEVTIPFAGSRVRQSIHVDLARRNSGTVGRHSLRSGCQGGALGLRIGRKRDLHQNVAGWVGRRTVSPGPWPTA